MIAQSKAENVTKSKKIKSLESIIKILEDKLSSARKDVILIQNDSSKKEAHSALLHKSENLFLKSKIAELENIKSELESKVNQLECLKSEAILKPVIGGDDEKNTQSMEQSSITKSDDISLDSTDLSKYFIRGKNMDPIEKIDGITELSKNNTEISSKVSEGRLEEPLLCNTNINKISENIISQSQEILNITPYLAQRENNMSPWIKSNSQIPIGGIGAISIVSSTLMLSLLAYMLLTLLIIAVMWFVILRRTWGLERKSERLRDM